MNGSLVDIKTGDITIKDIPVLIQPGQAYQTIGMALGYGRENCGKAGEKIGKNAFPLSNSKGR